MQVLNNEEMISVKGGAFNLTIATAIAGVVVFLVGVIDGLIHPKKC